jgi:uncharacterized protein (DUF1499 family)
LFSWKRPDYLGVKHGRLAPCKPTPNCVSSQAEPADDEHYIAPLEVKDMNVLRKVIESMRGASVVASGPNYLYVEFRTPILRFVDDVEFFFDGKVTQVRSASRLGRRDFGVNRKRIEELRSLIRARR